MKFCLVNFYTEGTPHDGGKPMKESAKRFVDAVTPFFDRHFEFTPRICREMFKESSPYIDDYSNWLSNHSRIDELVRFNPTWARVGFNSWKSLIVKKVLESSDMDEGDILFYHDTDIEKYPKYMLNANEWKEAAIEILRRLDCDIFAPSGLPLYKDVKAYAIRKHLKPFSQFETGVWNGLIILRKSKTSLKFIDEWYRMCSDMDLISPLPNPSPFPGHIWHSVDQSVMGVLAAKWRETGELPEKWPMFLGGDRSFGLKTLEKEYTPPSFLNKITQYAILMLKKKY
jgi:hypothetical protein